MLHPLLTALIMYAGPIVQVALGIVIVFFGLKYGFKMLVRGFYGIFKQEKEYVDKKRQMAGAR